MVKVNLKPVTVENWQDCIKLELAPAQEGFLPNNLYSIAEAQFYPEARSLAIYDEADQIVGYALFGRDVSSGKWKVFRFMIDRRHQGNGYGEAGIRQIIQQIALEPDGDEILICYQKTNRIAQSLYAKIGFIEQETDSNGKVTALLQFERSYTNWRR